MAGYTRQSTFADGDTITAALFNNEYNQLLNAFSNTTGHSHDGTANEGPVIGLIGDAGETSPNNKVLIDTTNNYIEFYVQVSGSPVQQMYIADGAIIPVTDSDVDLGTSSLYFKNAYIDSITTTGNVAVGGNLTVTGTTTFNGGTITMGDAATDNVVFGADVDSNIIPDDDDSYDLGSSSQQWKDIYIDGVAYVDAINFNGTAITSTAAELNILDGVTSTAAELNILDGVTASAADINLIDGITNGTVIASKAIITDANKDITGGRNITITGELDAATLDISGNADIDGTLETDALSINGTTVTSTAAELNILDGVTATAAEINALDGITSTVAELNILDGVTSTAAELNLLDGKAFLDEDDMSSNSATGIASQQSIKAYVDTQITAEDLDITTDSGTIAIDLDSETLTVSGGTGLDSSATGNAVTLAIDSTVATLTGSQTLTNKSLTAPTLTGTATVASLDISGDIDVDGTTNLDVVDIDGAVDMASTLNVSGAITGTLGTAAQPNITSLGTLTTLTVDDISINGSTISDSGDLTIDVSNDINLDAGGANIRFLDGGTQIGKFTNASNDLEIHVSTLNKDIIFKGNDGGSTTTALTLDMSDAGTAIFNHDVKVGSGGILMSDTLNNQANSANIIYRTGSTTVVGNNATALVVADSGGVSFGSGIDVTGTVTSDGLTVDGNGIITTSDNSDTLKLISTDADANQGPVLNLFRNSGSPADSDVLGQVIFAGENDNDEEIDYARLQGFTIDVSDGTESGGLNLQAMKAGTIRSRLKVNSTELAINDDAQNLDFRVESQNDTHQIFVDAANDKVGIGTGTPVELQHNFLDTNNSSSLLTAGTAANICGGFKIENNNSTAGSFAGIGLRSDSADGKIVLATDGTTNEGTFYILLDDGGGDLKKRLVITKHETILNEDSENQDFRVESNNEANMFVVNGGTDQVIITNSVQDDASPNYKDSLVLHNSQDGGSRLLFSNAVAAELASIQGGISGTGAGTDDGRLIFRTAVDATATEKMRMTTSAVIINEDSNDIDFRVESNNNANMLFVDGGNDHVNIGTSTDHGGVLNVETTGNNVNLVLVSTDTDSNAGPIMDFTRDAGNVPSDNDIMGKIRFRNDDTGLTMTNYAEITSVVADVSNGTEDGQLQFNIIDNGTLRNFAHMTGSAGTVFNEDSNDMDFRVESNGNTHMLFVDGGNDKVGIGTSSPQELVHLKTGGTTALRVSGANNDNSKVEIGYDNTNGPYIKAGSSGVTGLQFYRDNTVLSAEIHRNTGDFYTNDGTISSLSDSRVKENIEDLVDGLEVVKQLKPKTFKYNKKSTFYDEKTKDIVRYGFIADEVQEVAPQYTQVGKGKIDGVEVNDLKSLSTTKMIPMLVKAIQEQQTQIDALQSEINLLKGE